MSTHTAPGLATGAWRLDPARSSAEFHVRNLYGLMTVKGRFDRYDGTLDLSSRPAVALVIDAASLDTDVANHPQVLFEADVADLDGDRLKASGVLYAAGRLVVRGRLVRTDDAAMKAAA